MQFGGIYGGFALGVPAALGALVMLGLAPVVTTAMAIASGQEHGDARLWAGLAVGVVGVAISLRAGARQRARRRRRRASPSSGMLGLAFGTVLQKRWVGVADPRVSVAVAVGDRRDRSGPGRRMCRRPLRRLGTQLVLSLGWLAWGIGIVTLLTSSTSCARTPRARSRALLLIVPAVTAIASGRRSASRCTRRACSAWSSRSPAWRPSSAASALRRGAPRR